MNAGIVACRMPNKFDDIDAIVRRRSWKTAIAMNKQMPRDDSFTFFWKIDASN